MSGIRLVAAAEGDLTRVLARRGHPVLHARGIEEAVAVGRGDAHPLVVVEESAEVDAVAACRRLRAEAGGGRPVILVVTPDASPAHLAALVEAGADDWLTTPLDLAELHLRLRAAERRTGDVGGEGPVPSRLASERRLQSLVQNAPDVICILDPDGTIRYESPAAERVLGFAPADLVGTSALALIHPEDLPRVRQRFATLVGQTGRTQASTVRCRHADGTWRWIEAVSTNLLDDESIGGIVVNARDVTAAKEVEAALRASEERLRLALENAAMGTWEWDVASGRVDWSEHVGPLFGLPAGTERISSDAFFELVHPEDWDRVRAADRLSIDTEANYEVEYRVVRPDGTVRWLESRGRATARDEHGRATRFLGVTTDITARKAAEAELRENEHCLRALHLAAERQAQELALLDRVRLALSRELDLPALFRAVVEAIAEAFGYTQVSLYLLEGDVLVMQHQVGYNRVIHRIPVTEGVSGRTVRTGQPTLVDDVRGDPEFLGAIEGIVSEICVPLRDQDRVVGMLNVESTDGVRLTEDDLRLIVALSEHVNVAIGRARAFADARANEARFRGAFDHAPIGMAIVAPDGRFLRVNRSLCAMLGYADDELLTRTFQDITYPDDLEADLALVNRALTGELRTYQLEKRYFHKAGHVIWAQLSVSLVDDDDGRPLYFISQVEDISERKRLEARLQQLALHDPLTLLPNRLLFLDRLETLLRAGADRRRAVAVLFLDLDGFKLVNDSLGHEVGDRLLVAVAQRLRDCLRPQDTVARFGGDEFAVLLEVGSRRDATRVAERINEALRPPVRLEGRETYVTASIGIALGRSPRTDPPDLLREADIALYRAKAAGRATHAVFEPRMTAVVVARLEQETALRHALERGELCLHYQPKIALTSGRVVAVEALVRWKHPKYGLLPPASFIHLAEETGVIVPLGEWAVDEAGRRVRAWQDRYPSATSLAVAVNLSIRQFQQPALAARVARFLEATGLAAHHLELEITESVVMEDGADAQATLVALRELGVRLAIDDFGTGYSSLAYLRDLPVDTLKIDQVFVRRLADPGSLAIVRAVTSLAHDLGMSVTAEGIETADQLGALRALGIDRGQGFFFARPQPADAIDVALRDAPADGWRLAAPSPTSLAAS